MEPEARHRTDPTGGGSRSDSDGDRLTTVGLLLESATALRQLFHQRLDSELSLSTQSFGILIRLARSPGGELRMSELASQTLLTPSGLTRAVDRLHEQGLVNRRACPEDRRGAFAVLTSAGRDLMDRAVPLHRAQIDGVLASAFTSADERRLAELLRTLRDHLYRENGAWVVLEAPDADCPGAG
ncbi:MAG: MarR family winged helix-turn-helix transcriptional regulator [Acidimicrobiales bacterium]